jgi:hypothetical protein
MTTEYWLIKRAKAEKNLAEAMHHLKKIFAEQTRINYKGKRL